MTLLAFVVSAAAAKKAPKTFQMNQKMFGYQKNFKKMKSWQKAHQNNGHKEDPFLMFNKSAVKIFADE